MAKKPNKKNESFDAYDLISEDEKLKKQQTHSEDKGSSHEKDDENLNPMDSGTVPPQEATVGGPNEIGEIFDSSKNSQIGTTPAPPDNYEDQFLEDEIDASNIETVYEQTLSGDTEDPELVSEEDLPIKVLPPNAEEIVGATTNSSAETVKKSGEPIDNVPTFYPDGTDDNIGYNKIAEAIYEIIDNKNIDPPYNLGIIGKYGTGKSKIIEQIISRFKLAGNDSTNQYVFFDVGRFHDSKLIWASIIVEFFSTYAKKHPWIGKIKYAFANKGTLKRDLLILAGAVILSILTLWWKGLPNVIQFQLVFKALKYVIPYFSVILIVFRTYKIWTNPLVKGVFSRFNSYPTTPKLIKDRVELENRINQLSRAWLKNEEKIVLIVDNLDRCNPDKVISIVDEIFALMRAEELKKHLVCLIAVDERYLQNALKRKGRLSKEQEDYFEKLFALKVHLPKMDSITLEYFLEDTINLKLQKGFGEKRDKVKGKKDSDLEEEEKIIIHQYLNKIVLNVDCKIDLTPRKINRVVFAFRFIKFLWARLDPQDKQFNAEIVIKAICYEMTNYELEGKFPEIVKKYVKMVPVNFRSNNQRKSNTNCFLED